MEKKIKKIWKKRCMGCRQVKDCSPYTMMGVTVCCCSEECSAKRVKAIIRNKEVK